MKVFVCVIFICAFHFGTCDDNGFEYPEDWVDPGDMFTFDTVTKRNIKQKKEVALESHNTEIAVKDIGVVPEVQNKMSCPKCPECPKCTQTSLQQVSNNNNDIFLRRYIAYLFRKLQDVGKPPDYVAFNVRLLLPEKSWDLVNRFVDGHDVAVQDVINVLEESVDSVSPASMDEDFDTTWKFEDHFHVSLIEALQIGVLLLIIVATLSLELLSKVSWLSQLKRLVVLAFLITFPITYYQEYQIAVAESRSSAIKVPDYCTKHIQLSFPERISMSVRHYVSAEKDPCQKYHEDILIDPLWKVTPTKVLAVVFSKFFLEPLGHFGTAFSKTFKNVFSELPVHLWIPAFLFLMVLMVFLLLLVSVCFGYAWNLNLPFWSGIEIGPTQNLHAPRQMEQLMADHRQQMQLLQTVMERQNSQPVQALPAPTQTVSPSSGLISSLLGRFGLGGGNLPQQPQPPSSASKENNNLPYPAAPDFTQEHSVDAMPDLPPEALTLRRRVNRPPYPTHTEDQESFAAGDGPWVGPSSSAGHSPYVSPGAPPSYEDVDNRSQKSELAMDFRFEGVSDESVSSQTNPQDAETKSSSVVASDLKNSEVEKNDTDDSDIEILSPDSIKVACMDGN